VDGQVQDPAPAKAKAAPKTKTAKVEAPQAEEVVLETVALEATEAEASAPEVEAAAVEAVEAATAESAEPETAEDFADEDELELLLNAEEEEEVIFDWDAYEAGYGSRSEEHKAIEKLYEATLVTSVEHQVVNGVVVQITDRDVIIDISSRTKGGMIVDVFGLEAFLPGSQIDVKPIRDYDVYVDKTMEFKIVKINHEFKNVVVSHKALIEADLEEQKRKIVGLLEKGQVLEGVVKNITSYGVFVDLGGVDGLVHITDLSWSRINHPSEVVELDQKMNVVILDFDEAKTRIQLGLKQLSAHPWDALDASIQAGDTIKGKVVVLADYGAFIEIAPGVEGLVHVSEMSWGSHLRSAQDFFKVGEVVEASVLSVDRAERKMSLGIKQLTPDPWSSITSKYPIGHVHTGEVRNFTNFGVFVELEEGIDGLIHISDLSWLKKVKHPSEFTAVGAKLEVKVMDIDVENRRLSLGHKQVSDNPWDSLEDVYSVGSIHTGSVKSAADKGFNIWFANAELEAYCPPRHSVKLDNSSIAEGEELEFSVIEFNRDSRRILVSHTQAVKGGMIEDDSDAPKGKKGGKGGAGSGSASGSKTTVQSINAQVEKSTLGDFDSLARLKEEMEGKE